MELPFPVEEIRTAIHELVGRNGLAECYLRPFAFYGYGELGVSTKGNPVEVVVMSWPWGNYLGDENAATGIRCKISSWKRIGANTIPHVAKATGIYLNSMLAVHEAQNARLRRGDPAHRRRIRRRRLGREHLRRQGREDLDAAALHLDPARDHARQRDPDRAGPRLRGRGGEPHPLRPLPRRGDLHDGHRRRSDAGQLRRRPRDRRRPGHARAAEGVSRHRARQVATAGATGSTASRWATRLPPEA